MLFVKTLFLAVLGFNAMTFAAPANAGVADTASTNVIQDAATAKAIQDLCDRIPRDERHKYRECEEARSYGDINGECYEIHRAGKRARKCGDRDY